MPNFAATRACSWCCWRPNSAPTRRSASSSPARRRRAAKGSYALTPADFESGLEACLALWLPPSTSALQRDRHAAARTMAARALPAARLAGGGTASRSQRCARLTRCLELAAQLRPAGGGGRRCAHAPAQPAAAAGSADRDSSWLHSGHGRRAPVRQRRAASALAADARAPLSAGAARPPASPSPSAAVSSSANCTTNIRPNWCRPGSSAAAQLRLLSEAGARQRWPAGRTAGGSDAAGEGAAADRRAQLRALLSHRA